MRLSWLRICWCRSRSSRPGSTPSFRRAPSVLSGNVQRLGLPSAAVEGEHQQLAQPLAQRVRRDERLQLAAVRLGVPPGVQIMVDALLERRRGGDPPGARSRTGRSGLWAKSESGGPRQRASASVTRPLSCSSPERSRSSSSSPDHPARSLAPSSPAAPCRSACAGLHRPEWPSSAVSEGSSSHSASISLSVETTLFASKQQHGQQGALLGAAEIEDMPAGRRTSSGPRIRNSIPPPGPSRRRRRDVSGLKPRSNRILAVPRARKVGT